MKPTLCSCLGLLFGQMLVLRVGDADSNPKAAGCGDESAVHFDGTRTLQYATVAKLAGRRLYVHPTPPTNCRPSTQGQCPAPTYLIPGDDVAIADACNGWAYVQYLGTSKVTTGWVARDYLMVRSAPMPREPSDGQSVYDRRYQFELIKGAGTPVCEAYLQRLNQTLFDSPPYCGRPESTLVPGFTFLHRRYLSLAEYNRLQSEVLSLVNNEPQHDEDLDASFRPSAWTYAMPLDIKNDASPLPILIWDGSSQDHPLCGTGGPANGGSNFAVVLEGNPRRVDAAATMQLFGVPASMRQNGPVLTEIGRSFGIVEYRSAIYYDTFVERDVSDLENEAYRRGGSGGTLGLFEFRNGVRRAVCGYYVPNLGDE